MKACYASSLSLANSTAVTRRAALLGLASDAPGLRDTAGTAAPGYSKVYEFLPAASSATIIRTRTKPIHAPSKSGRLPLSRESNRSGSVGSSLCQLCLELLKFCQRRALRRRLGLC